MEAFLHQLLSGLATGGIYASLALALVMIYQSTSHINFAQGEMAMFSTYLAWSLINSGLPYWWAFLLTVAISFVGGVVIERVIIRPVEHAPVLSIVTVFIALLVIFNSVAGWIFTYTIKTFPSPFPEQPLFGHRFISSHELGSIGITLAVLVMLYLFFRFTPLGLAMRAAAQNPVSSRLVGVRVGWMLALGWGWRLQWIVRAAGGADRVPGPNMSRRAAVRLRRCAGGDRQSVRRGGGGFGWGVLENLRRLRDRHGIETHGALVLIIGVLLVKPTGCSEGCCTRVDRQRIREGEKGTREARFAGIRARHFEIQYSVLHDRACYEHCQATPATPASRRVPGGDRPGGVLCAAVALPFLVAAIGCSSSIWCWSTPSFCWG